MQDFKPLNDAILNGNATIARTTTEAALAAGVRQQVKGLVGGALSPKRLPTTSARTLSATTWSAL